MRRLSRIHSSLTVIGLLLLVATQDAANPAPPPNPVVTFMGSEYLEVSGSKQMRYYFDVVNKEAYSPELFAASPDLPPCGNNTKASRTWIDIYDERGKRLNGFCAIGKPADLTKLWFSLNSDVIPPSYIYIEFTDRQTNTKYKSNLAETTL